MDVTKLFLENVTPVRKFVILLLDAHHDEPIRGKLWYQKELFLLSKIFRDLADDADFDAYLWGPHSELADTEMEDLSMLGVVETIGNKFILTETGKAISKIIAKRASAKERKYVHEIKDFLNDLSSQELLAFTYFTYPDMTEESVEFKKILPKRKFLAVDLYKKDKISIGKAAELAGLKITDFIDHLKRQGIRPEIKA